MTDENWSAEIDDVNYPIAVENGQVLWQTVHTEDQPERWDDWSLGLGEHYIKCEGFDATTKGVLRLAPFYHNDNNPSDLTTARGYFMEDVGSATSLTFDQGDGGSTDSWFVDDATSLTESFTIASNADRLLVVHVAKTSASITSMTYGGQALTKLGGTNAAQLWYLVNPATGANNLVVAWASSVDAVLFASSWYNVSTDTPFGDLVTNTGADDTPTVTVVGGDNDFVVDAMSAGNQTATVGAGQTEVASNGLQDNKRGAASYQDGATAGDVMSWSLGGSAGWEIAAVPIKPATAKYVYAADATKITEYIYDPDTGLTDNSSQTIASGVAGRPARFKGKWYCPFGSGANVYRLDSVGGGTRWVDSGFKAAHLAVFQQGVLPRLARAEATDKNEIGLATSAPTADNSFDAGIGVGDTSTDITDLAEAGGQLFVAKEDGLYRFGTEGESRQVLPEAFDRGRPDSENGQGMVAFGDIVYYPSNQGLWRYRIGYGALPVGLGTLRGLRNLGNIDTPKNYRHADIAVAGEWLYELANSGETSLLLAMRQRREGDPGGHEMIIHSVLKIPLSKGIGKDSKNHLWLKGASTSEDDRDIRVIVLDENGGLDITSRRGQASADHDITLMQSDWGRPREIKQLRGMTVNVIDTLIVQATVTGLAKAYLDNSAIATIDSTTIGFFSAEPVTRNYTVGTSDTAYRVHGHLTATSTSGYFPKIENLEIGGITLWARAPETLRVVIDTRKLTSIHPVTAEKNLRRLQQQGPVTIRRSGDDATFSGEIESVTDTYIKIKENEYASALELRIRRWTTP